MKTMSKKILSFMLSIEIFVLSFFSYSTFVYASDFVAHDIIEAIEYGCEFNDWEPFYNFLSSTGDGLMYLLSQTGAVVNKDFVTWVDNNDKLQSMANVVPAKEENNNIVFTEEFISQLRALLDEYAKENEPYFLVPVASYKDLDVTKFSNKAKYETLCHLAKEYGLIGVNGSFIADLSPIQKNGYSYVASGTYTNKDLNVTPVWTCAYNVDWQWKGFYFYSFDFTDRTEKYISFDQGTKSTDLNLNVQLFSYLSPNFSICNGGSIMNSWTSISNAQKASMISRDRVRIRVYNTVDDLKRYSVGQRYVYYTNNYYEYVPADITVSSDELQQGIDDINTALDTLLDQIDNNTSETDIENILQQILDELKNNHSGGSGTGGEGTGGTGTGGSTVDMSTTNSWLEKIYNKVCDIFDKMGQKDEDNPSVSENSVGMSDINNVLKLIWANTNVIVEKLMPDDSVSGNSVSGNSIDMTYTNSVLDSIKAGMDEMTELLKKIKGWTVADTILDGVGAISDLVSLIGDFLNDAGAVVSTAAESLAETADMMTDKFPFSIPWDLAMLVGILQAEPRAPVFHLPLVIESYGIEESIDIDMSQFDSLSVIMRSMLTILYAYGILNMTTKVLNIGGGNK